MEDNNKAKVDDIYEALAAIEAECRKHSPHNAFEAMTSILAMMCVYMGYSIEEVLTATATRIVALKALQNATADEKVEFVRTIAPRLGLNSEEEIVAFAKNIGDDVKEIHGKSMLETIFEDPDAEEPVFLNPFGECPDDFEA